MEYITLSNSDLNVSRLCMGGCPMGGYGWGNVQEKDLVDAVHGALDAGVNFFDTADTYGIGKSEETLGKSLKGRRNQAVIATKFGVRVENGQTFYDNSAEWICSALEGSLKRLGTDYIDLYQIHYRDGKTSIAEVIETLNKLKAKGLIRYFGLSNIHKEDIPEVSKHIGQFVSFQDEYSLACRKNESDMFDLSKELQLTPFTWGSLGQGILTGKYDKNVTFSSDDRRSRTEYINFHGEKLLKNLEIVEAMKEISASTGRSLPSVAIRFIMDYLTNSVVITGIKNKDQLHSNLQAMDWNLDQHQIKQLLNSSSC